ncbi:MAG: hypothetical protein ABJN84_16905 [Flavobacteriaceae bacterium]
MEDYKTRKINFKELIGINDWKVKIYTISKTGEFNHSVFYQSVINQLPNWLKLENGFDSSNDKIAFLILHSGTEGIFSLINWWVGQNMLNTNIFMTNPEIPSAFTKISGKGLAPCVWELEIINHERVSWTKNILKQMTNPNYNQYLKDVINIEL